MLLLVLLSINVYKLSAGAVSKSSLVYDELPFPFRETHNSKMRWRVKKGKISGCRQKKTMMRHVIPEFIDIPKTGGEFVTTLGYHYLRAANGSKVTMHWGRRYDWPAKEDWPKDSLEIMMKDDTHHCAPWHRPPHFWWQLPTNSNIHMPYTSRTFCVVRNPYSRLLAQFNLQRTTEILQLKRAGQSVEGMSGCIGVKDVRKMIYQNLVMGYEMHHKRLVNGSCHYLPQSEYVFDVDGCLVCDDVLLFEELEDQVKGLLRMYDLGNEDDAFDNINYYISSPCPVINLLELHPKLLEIINERYLVDFKEFKYKMIIPKKSED